MSESPNELKMKLFVEQALLKIQKGNIESTLQYKYNDQPLCFILVTLYPVILHTNWYIPRKGNPDPELCLKCAPYLSSLGEFRISYRCKFLSNFLSRHFWSFKKQTIIDENKMILVCICFNIQFSISLYLQDERKSTT